MIVGVRVIVGVLVMVGVRDGVGLSVAVGLNVAVGLSVGVGESDGVGVGVRVGVVVGVSVVVGVDVVVLVGVLGDRSGVSVTLIEILRSIVRALIPSIGSPLATERSIKGTNLGTMGKKSPSISTTRRWLLSARIELVRLVSVTIPLKQNSVGVVPGP